LVLLLETGPKPGLKGRGEAPGLLGRVLGPLRVVIPTKTAQNLPKTGPEVLLITPEVLLITPDKLRVRFANLQISFGLWFPPARVFSAVKEAGQPRSQPFIGRVFLVLLVFLGGRSNTWNARAAQTITTTTPTSNLRCRRRRSNSRSRSRSRISVAGTVIPISIA